MVSKISDQLSEDEQAMLEICLNPFSAGLSVVPGRTHLHLVVEGDDNDLCVVMILRRRSL